MSLARHTLYNLGASVLPLLLSLVTVPIYLKYIGTERYGVLAVIWAILNYFGFFDLGFGRAVSQRMAKLSETDGSERSKLLWTALLCTLGMGILASGVLWLFADYILLDKIEMTNASRAEVSGALYWMLIALPVILPMTVLIGALQARLRFGETNAIQLIGNLISVLLPLALSAQGYVTLDVLVPAALVSRLVMLIMLLNQCSKYVPLTGKPRIDYVHFKALISYGGWVSIMAFLAPLLVTVDRLIIATLSGAKAVAYYTVPYDLASRASIVSSSLGGAIFPRLAAADSEQGLHLAVRATKLLIAVMTPVVVAAMFLARPFLTIWVGEAFATASAGVTELILIGVWINALVIPHYSRMLASEDPKVVVMIYLFEIPIYLSMMWMGIKLWGVVGAAAAWSLRILMDTTILLNKNKALWETVKQAAPSAVLIGLSAGIVLFANFSPAVYWCVGWSMAVYSIFRDRVQLFGIVKSLRLQK